jgi:hypothetical protein
MSHSVLDPSLNLLTIPNSKPKPTDSDKTPKKRLATAAHWVFTHLLEKGGRKHHYKIFYFYLYNI